VDTEKKDIMVPMDLTADELHQVLDVVIESTAAEARLPSRNLSQRRTGSGHSRRPSQASRKAMGPG